MNRWIAIVFFFMCIPILSDAQVVFSEPVELTAALQKYISDCKEETDMEAWRIQVLATTDRRQMETAFRRFKELFPELDVEWVHQEPYYKLKAGAFINRRQSLAKCQEVRQHFSQALPVIERIAYEDLIK